MFRRGIAAAQETLAAKQRPLDEYTASNRAAKQQEVSAELGRLQERRDAAARVSVHTTYAHECMHSVPAAEFVLRQRGGDAPDSRRLSMLL